ncbi:MAG: vitamin K epoxide reductase family protein, partial [Gemmatimonadota bacterium]
DEAAASGAGAGEEADPGEAAAAPELTPRDGDGAGAESGGRVESVTRSARDSLLAAAVSRDPSAALHSVSLTDRLMLDPAGNGAAIAVLVLMLIALGLVAADRAGRLRIPESPEWAIPVLSVIGIGVAAYLAYVEVSGVEAICGPVGDCNTVQQSRFARLFGVLPVGVLGVLGYLVLLGLWAVARRFEGHRARILTLTWTLALFAVLFSVYLTFLEPFVIGASCAWCLSSAVITTLILLALTPARRAGDGVRPVAEPERAAVSGRRT